MSSWTLLSNHGHVLLFLARHPEARLRDVADQVGITERAVQKIVRDLQSAEMLRVIKVGRRNQYSLNLDVALRHPLEAHRSVGSLVKMVHGKATRLSQSELPEFASALPDRTEQDERDGSRPHSQQSVDGQTTKPLKSTSTSARSPTISKASAKQTPVESHDVAVDQFSPKSEPEDDTAGDKEAPQPVEAGTTKKKSSRKKKPTTDIDQGSLF